MSPRMLRGLYNDSMKNVLGALIALILTVVAFQLLVVVWHGVWLVARAAVALAIGGILFVAINRMVQRVLN